MSITGNPRAQVRVGHMTTVHRPFDARIFFKEAASTAEGGFSTFIIQSGGEVGRRSGVEVLTLPAYKSRYARITRGVWDATRLALRHRLDIAHIHDPELVWGGYLLKLRGVKVVYDVHENLHLDIMAKPWLPTWSKRPLGLLAGLLEWTAARCFDRIVAATDNIAQRFPKQKTVLVKNAPIIADLKSDRTALPIHERGPTMVYIGGLGGGSDIKGVNLMLNALAKLPTDSAIRLLLGGPEPSPGFIDDLKKQPGGDRIDYVGYVNPNELGKYYGLAIGSLILYPPAPNNIASEPVKLFESMAAGVPAIISDFPVFADYIQRAGCGFTLDPFDAEAVAARMLQLESDRELAHRLGENGRHFIENDHNWALYSARLLAMYDDLVPAAARSNGRHRASS